MSLSKTETVLHFSGPDESDTEHRVKYGSELEPNEDSPNLFRSHILYLSKDVYEEMGSPKVITMTVVPGDALNES